MDELERQNREATHAFGVFTVFIACVAVSVLVVKRSVGRVGASSNNGRLVKRFASLVNQEDQPRRMPASPRRTSVDIAQADVPVEPLPVASSWSLDSAYAAAMGKGPQSPSQGGLSSTRTTSCAVDMLVAAVRAARTSSDCAAQTSRPSSTCTSWEEDRDSQRTSSDAVLLRAGTGSSLQPSSQRSNSDVMLLRQGSSLQPSSMRSNSDVLLRQGSSLRDVLSKGWPLIADARVSN